MSKIARSGSEGNARLLKEYGGTSSGRKAYADGGAVRNPALDEGLSAASKPGLSAKPAKADKGQARTNINVVMTPGSSGMAPPPPMPGAMAGPPPMPPVGGPPMPGLPGGPGAVAPMPMRAAGGRVSAKDQAMKHDVTGTSPGKYARGGKVHDDAAMDKAATKAAVHKHEKAMHPGKPMTKLAKGGMAKMPSYAPHPAPKATMPVAKKAPGAPVPKNPMAGAGGGLGRLQKIKDYGK